MEDDAHSSGRYCLKLFKVNTLLVEYFVSCVLFLSRIIWLNFWAWLYLFENS